MNNNIGCHSCPCYETCNTKNDKPTENIENYQKIGNDIGKMVAEKNKQYGDSISDTAEFLKILFPNGIESDSYKDLGILVRIYDKMKRIANGNAGNENAYNDIAGYGILMSKYNHTEQKKPPESTTEAHTGTWVLQDECNGDDCQNMLDEQTIKDRIYQQDKNCLMGKDK